MKKTNKTFVRSMFGLLLVATTMGCYPDQPEFVEEYDVAYSNYDSDFNFSTSLTYSLPDEVIRIDDEIFNDGEPEYLDAIFADAILSNVRSNLNAKGWTEVDEANDPDIVILPSAFDETFLYTYNPGYWGWYYPGYFPGWGWYYPYTPSYVGGYTTGTVLLQMTVPSQIQNDEVPVVWVAAFNGLLQGSDSYISGRIDSNLDQIFTHPPFND